MFETRGKWMKRIDAPRLEAAVKAAESRTSGEIRVSVSTFFHGDVRRVAEKAFDRLGMANTAARNGVLIFVVPSRRKFVVLGDAGIHEKVGADVWEQVARAISEKFRSGDFTGGLEAGVSEIGARLAEYFPHAGDSDRNELPDGVDFS